MAGFDPASVKYVEAHGTGTEVGDPLNSPRSPEPSSLLRSAGSCALGSLKTNIGHLDTAAGVAGLIKTALCVKNRMICRRRCTLRTRTLSSIWSNRLFM